MAFASNGHSLPFVTEKDIIRQLASNYTKHQITQQLSSHEKHIDGKLVMKDNLTRVKQVWAAFVKFVTNQVVTNGKLVDTQLIGLIFKSGHAVCFLPSIDYVEAGKFKFRQGGEVVDGL